MCVHTQQRWGNKIRWGRIVQISSTTFAPLIWRKTRQDNLVYDCIKAGIKFSICLSKVLPHQPAFKKRASIIMKSNTSFPRLQWKDVHCESFTLKALRLPSVYDWRRGEDMFCDQIKIEVQLSWPQRRIESIFYFGWPFQVLSIRCKVRYLNSSIQLQVPIIF